MSKKYKNKGGDSSVSSYESEKDAIKVKFNDGSTYKYTRESAGSKEITQMKRFATQGEGLNSYINRNARDGYEEKS